MRAFARPAALALAALASVVVGCPAHEAVVESHYDSSAQDAASAPVDAAVADAQVVQAPPADPSMPPAPAFDADFTRRLRHLLDAIGTNNPALCHDVQLPRKAYAEDYATKDLARTWDRGVDAAFKKGLARLHRKQKRIELAFVSLDVPKPMALVPGREREGWRSSYWRVERTKLHARPVAQAPGDAKETVIDLASLVYWRGAWYVERL